VLKSLLSKGRGGPEWGEINKSSKEEKKGSRDQKQKDSKIPAPGRTRPLEGGQVAAVHIDGAGKKK